MKEQNKSVKPLGIPYGMMNFVAIREDNYTMLIRLDL